MKKIFKSIFAFAIIFASIIPLYTDTANAKTSYMRAKNKIYYGTDEGSSFAEKYVKTKSGYRITHFNYKDKDEDDYYNWQKETKTGLYEKGGYKLLPYPIKLDKTWKFEGEIHKIIDTDATVKIKAGTFKHVVVERDYPAGNTKKKYYYTKNYYAPNIGWIKQEFISYDHDIDSFNGYKGDDNIDIDYELTKIKPIKK